MIVIGFKLEHTGTTPEQRAEIHADIALVVLEGPPIPAELRCAAGIKKGLEKYARQILEESLGENDASTIFDNKEGP